ncbi:hypothetical protein OKT22_03835 [Providencia rettgeri]|uniref:hypothetical protein n=1 Tax=Providencia rettgeri TaxID=587 RepID=UPI00226DC574|nr:hypothetical protein [Providencia rettgeri]MCX9108159.1 hypothetical protein [Providencia rettgeri]
MGENKKQLIGKILYWALCIVYVLVLLYLMPYVLGKFLGKETYTDTLFISAFISFLASKCSSSFWEVSEYNIKIVWFLDLISIGGIQSGVASIIPNETCSLIFTLFFGFISFYLISREYEKSIKLLTIKKEAIKNSLPKKGQE